MLAWYIYFIVLYNMIYLQCVQYNPKYLMYVFARSE